MKKVKVQIKAGGPVDSDILNFARQNAQNMLRQVPNQTTAGKLLHGLANLFDHIEFKAADEVEIIKEKKK